MVRTASGDGELTLTTVKSSVYQCFFVVLRLVLYIITISSLSFTKIDSINNIKIIKRRDAFWFIYGPPYFVMQLRLSVTIRFTYVKPVRPILIDQC